MNDILRDGIELEIMKVDVRNYPWKFNSVWNLKMIW